MSIERTVPQHIAIMLRESEMAIHREYLQTTLSRALPKVRLQLASSASDLTDLGTIDTLITPVQPWLDVVTSTALNLKWIHFLSAGVDGIWNFAFDKSRYILTKSSGVHAIPMAEYAVGGILYFLKGFHIYSCQQQERKWKRYWLEEATGKTVAILGLGAIGKEVAKRCRHMGMTVTGMATSVRQVEHVDVVCDASGIEGILRNADFVVVCLPLTTSTQGLLDSQTLAAIKPGAYVIDISRGGVVDQEALARLLRHKHLGGALLDVFETEPLPADSEVWDLDNVLITPHVSGTTPLYMKRALKIFLENAEALRSGRPPVTPVNIGAGY